MRPEQLERAAAVFSTLSESSRLQLLQELMQGPRTVGELVSATGLKQGNASKQLGILYASGLVNRNREGNFIRYSIRDEMVFRLCDLVCESLRKKALEEVECFSA